MTYVTGRFKQAKYMKAKLVPFQNNTYPMAVQDGQCPSLLEMGEIVIYI